VVLLKKKIVFTTPGFFSSDYSVQTSTCFVTFVHLYRPKKSMNLVQTYLESSFVYFVGTVEDKGSFAAADNAQPKDTKVLLY